MEEMNVWYISPELLMNGSLRQKEVKSCSCLLFSIRFNEYRAILRGLFKRNITTFFQLTTSEEDGCQKWKMVSGFGKERK
jgi:hypothetical protein